MTRIEWMPIRYRNVISILKNPFYAGVYVYGKSEKRTEIIDGRAPKSYGHGKPIGTWEVPATMYDLWWPAVDAAVTRELLRAVEPMAIEAALEAERMHRERQDEQQRPLDLELQQARYEANLAERRYAACDPDNRLIATQLEKNWEIALRRVQELQARHMNESRETVAVDPSAFAHLADNLSAAWNAPGVTMRARQRLLRAPIVNIVVDVDEQAREVVLTHSLARRPAFPIKRAQAAE